MKSSQPLTLSLELATTISEQNQGSHHHVVYLSGGERTGLQRRINAWLLRQTEVPR